MGIKKIIKGCKKGDLKAQEELYRLFAPKLFGVSLRFSRNYQEAEDNLQEAFLIIFKNIDQYKNLGSFEGWLKRITRNTALQTYRRQNVFPIIDEEFIKDAEEVNIREEEVSLDYLLKIIQELPDRYRMVFNLYVLDGYSHREIAKKLNISEGTSKSNLARARQNLKIKLEERRKLRYVK